METTGTNENYVEINDQKIVLEGATLLHLNEIRKWTQFLSILGFVAIGIFLFVGVIMLVVTSLQNTFQYEPLGFITPYFGIVYFIVALIYFFPVLYMYQFSRNAKHSLLKLGSGGSSNELMANAIEYMKKHFRYVGICTIVILSIYLLVVIGVFIAFAIK